MYSDLADLPDLSQPDRDWETGEISGVPHIQGYIKCKTSGLKYEAAKALYPFVFERCNFEQARANLTANIKYCTKERTRLMGPWTHNIESEQGKRNDLVNACDTLKKGGLDELIEEFPEVFVKYPQGFQKLRSLLLLKKHKTESKNLAFLPQPLIIVIHGDSGWGKTVLAYKILKKIGKPFYQMPPPLNDAVWSNGS